MSARRDIPDAVREVQIAASDPRVSAWVAANAGAGKTYVLAQRVIRLLLDSVNPEKILCVTFTKAAAANMAKRVFDTLAAWTALGDAALDEAIRQISNVKPDAMVRARARRLFAQALETPGGLKVQTIHAFCTRLLHQFPFEANVAARFEVLDETAQRQLLERLNLEVLLDAAAEPASSLSRALATAIAHAADQTFKDVVNEAICMREAVSGWIAHAGGIENAIAELANALGIDPDDSLSAVDAEILDSPILPPSEWAAVAAALAQGQKTDQAQADRLIAADKTDGNERCEAYLGVFFNLTDRKPRTRLVTKAIVESEPQLAERLAAEQQRLVQLIERRRAVALRDRTAALVAIAEAVISRYRAEKDQRGLLDYDDLIEKTLALLDNTDAAWVHYKLDLGIDHVLIDEAQDTSPQQWEIISKIVSEFAAGAGARGMLKRTVFAVGDEKQSIFSFQGAAPDKFDEMRRVFQDEFDRPELGWRFVRFHHSFRSGANVLGAVDVVFDSESVFTGVIADAGGVPPHEALPGAAPGLVEIWPLEKADEKREIEGWDAPFDELIETSPQMRLANRIARHVRYWIDQRLPIGSARAPLTPGDVLVLVSRRGPPFEAIIRALKNANIAVAGADRLVLTEHIAVMDLMVLGDTLLLPDDDLALATVLKSPLFGFDDDDLFKLAWDRKASLWRALNAKAGDDPRYADAAERLARFALAAKKDAPFDFYARVLGPEHGRKQFLARLGVDATDPLDEFLNLTLDYERRGTPSLQGFLAWLRGAQAEVKRDMEIARDEVRVMTVHGAKGLEAPVVILADTTAPPAGHAQHQARILKLPAAVPSAPDRLVWVGAKTEDIAAVADARDRAGQDVENEYRRLLYVAMTRAAERLVVCGVEGERRRPEGCWYDLVCEALAPPVSVEEPADDGDGTVWRYRKEAAKDEAPSAAAVAAPDASVLPSWLHEDAPAEAPRQQPLSPSRAYDEKLDRRADASADGHRKKAMQRGNVVHRLLQSLPDIPKTNRAEAAKRFLAHAAKEFTEEERAKILKPVLAMLDDTRFAALFAPGSRAEVPIVGRIAHKGQTVAVSGQVDRLVITADEILIVDYKTNRRPPSRVEDAPDAYKAQLALYRAVLRQLYPKKTIRAALVWTDVPDLMAVSASALDKALDTVSSS